MCVCERERERLNNSFSSFVCPFYHVIYYFLTISGLLLSLKFIAIGLLTISRTFIVLGIHFLCVSG